MLVSLETSLETSLEIILLSPPELLLPALISFFPELVLLLRSFLIRLALSAMLLSPSEKKPEPPLSVLPKDIEGERNDRT